MSRRIVLKGAAEADLDRHFLFIAQDSVETAIRFHDAAQRAFDRLAGLPEIGARRTFSDPRLAAIRMWSISEFPNHLIYYAPVADGIVVLRVLHARQDVDRVFEAR